MVNGSGNCGLAPGSQAQSGEFAFQKCTWASTIVRLLAGCGRACCALVASAAPATSVVPKFASCQHDGPPCWRRSLGGVSSLEDCNLGTAKRNPGPCSLPPATCATIVARAFSRRPRRGGCWVRTWFERCRDFRLTRVHCEGTLQRLTLHRAGEERCEVSINHRRVCRHPRAALCTAQIRSGNCTTKLSRFGIRTFGSVAALISSFSPISLFLARR